MKITGWLIVTAAMALSVRQAEAQVTLETRDGLRIELSAEGRVSALSVDGSDCLNPEGASGFELMDVAADERVEVGASVVATEEGARQEVTLNALGLAFEAHYVVHPDHLEIVGAVRDLRGEDRAVDVLFRLPVGGAGWHTWLDVTTRMPLSPTSVERAQVGGRLELWIYGFDIDGTEGVVAVGPGEESLREIGAFGTAAGDMKHRAFAVRGIAESDLHVLAVKLEQ